jgi:hypothetical protein
MTTQRYRVNKQPRLIDLNNDLTNFKLTFSCSSFPENAIYKIHVATQTELDVQEIDSLPFREITGKVNGDVIADENKYDNYFLILCSEQEIEVDVSIDIEMVEPKMNINPTQPPQENVILSNSYWTPSTIFFWVAFSLIILFLIYFLFIRKQSKKSLVEDSSSREGHITNYSLVDDINDL